jgi:hypothetical protein
MRLLIIGVLMVLIGSTGAFAQQQKQVAQKASQGGRCTSDACVRGSLKAGWTNAEASGWCSKPENLIPWCKQYLK